MLHAGNTITSGVIIHKLKDQPRVIDEGQLRVQPQMTAQLETLRIAASQGDREAQWELSHNSAQLPF